MATKQKKKKETQSSRVFYPENERIIYSYWNGEKEVHADPMVLYKRMVSRAGEMQVEAKLARSIHKDAVQGHDDLVQHIREIFEVKPLDQGGLAELEALELFDNFIDWCDLLKKNSSPSSISSTVASATSSPMDSTTQASSASGSTASVSSTAEPPLSPKESPLPSDSKPPDSTTSVP